MLHYPRDIPLVTEKRSKKGQSSFRNLMQSISGIFPSVICLCIYRATVSCRQVTRPCSIAINNRDFNFYFHVGSWGLVLSVRILLGSSHSGLCTSCEIAVASPLHMEECCGPSPAWNKILLIHTCRWKRWGIVPVFARIKDLKYLVLVPGTLVHLCKFIFGKQMCYIDRVRWSKHLPMHVPSVLNTQQGAEWVGLLQGTSHGHSV